ncbi:MAG TPA: DUF1109 domain-containing protein [Nevskia sp.]|nr:DUF1109 domain-containing protein [Nevskia sp.]
MKMPTEELIQSLARDVPAVPPHATGRRLASGLLAGGAVVALCVVAGLGIRPDLRQAATGVSFWMKWTYAAWLGTAAFLATTRLARPTSQSFGSVWPIAMPVLLLALVGTGELAHTPASEWPALFLGKNWTRCLVMLLLLSLPMSAGVIWSFRRFAPTRPRAAGAAASLTAGSWAAAIYCLHCPEISAVFVLTWYSLALALVAAAGALWGPRLLRW